jgi:hypothetical protein
MDVNFIPTDFPEPICKGWDWPLIWDIEFNPGLPVAEFREILRDENWQPLKLGYGLESNPKRHVLAAPYKSKVLQNIDRAFTHEAFKLQLIETIRAVPYFNNLWPTDKLAEHTEVSTLWSRDLPGFEISPHLDNRLQICTGMIFFNEKNDPASGTKFTRTNGGEVFKTGNSGFGQGWLLVHDYHGWHYGKNASDSDRYHLTFHLKIKV